MPTQPPYVNHAYWKQLTLLDGGFDRVFQRFTIAYHGPEDRMAAGVEVFNDTKDRWMELEGPIWQGSLTEVGCLSSCFQRHVKQAQEYLRPF